MEDFDLAKINLQQKTKAKRGQAEKYWFENENIGLAKTLFHRITIPLEPFDSGLEYEQQPVETEIVIEWLNLGLKNPDDLDGVELSQTEKGIGETTIYVGSAHNWCEIEYLKLNRIQGNIYNIQGKLLIDFETEGVGENEIFEFETLIEYHANS